MPSGELLRVPTKADLVFAVEEARAVAVRHDGNARNFEDKWYIFWLRVFYLWSLYMVCKCTPTAQDASWAMKDVKVEDAYKNIKIVPAVSGKHGDAVQVPQITPTETEAAMLKAGFVTAVENNDQMPEGNASPDLQSRREASSSKQKGKGREIPQPEVLSAASQHTESGRANTVQRIPDTSIVAFNVPDLTPEAAAEILNRRILSGGELDAATGSNTPRGDPLNNPIKFFRAQHLPPGLIACILLQAEHKGLPSRQLEAALWLIEFHARKKEGQDDAALQGYVYLSNIRYHPHQDEVLLLATVGDYWTHTIMRRIPVPSEDKARAFQIQMEEWSEPVIVGSALSNEREDVLIAWINKTFPADFAPQLARRATYTERDKTPELDPQLVKVASQEAPEHDHDAHDGAAKRDAPSPTTADGPATKSARRRTRKPSIVLVPVETSTGQGKARTTRRTKAASKAPPVRTVAWTRAKAEAAARKATAREAAE
ncbi:hypothetical protein BD626DRAFT_626954 [Schizophyllum amplum]|uniref:Uncharacterized protein n=1 Tax=Schizophyllum amplum TaxID=97359 RepID=A0A550CV77_9AGAR|nr:hypothetical protein BD626DRAFT_626954 [Auriculariopsis ampla]